jgi:hypothetical protein
MLTAARKGFKGSDLRPSLTSRLKK